MSKRQFLCNKTLSMGGDAPVSDTACEICEDEQTIWEEVIVFHIGRLYEEIEPGLGLPHDPQAVCLVDDSEDGHWVGSEDVGWLKHFIEVTE